MTTNDLDFPQPYLVPSLTEDDEDSDEKKQQTVEYLLRYETMVRQQEAEDLATLEHIRPCLERLEELAGIQTTKKKKNVNMWTRTVSFRHLQKALNELEQAEQNSSSDNDTPELLTTDRQLMMVLKLLTQHSDHAEEDENEATTLTWAEFLQAYKTCIAGMLTLQHLPSGDVRQRARDRTLALLSLFESPSTKLFGSAAPVVESSALTAETQRPGAASHMPKQRQQRRGWRSLAIVVVTLVLATGSFAGGMWFGQQQQHEIESTMNTTTTATTPPPKEDTPVFQKCPAPKIQIEEKIVYVPAPAPPVKTTKTTTTRVQSVLPSVQPKTTMMSQQASIDTEKPASLPAAAAVSVPNSNNNKAKPIVMVGGGVLGMASTPFVASVLGITMAGAASVAVLAAGMASLAATVVQGIWHLVQTLRRKN